MEKLPRTTMTLRVMVDERFSVLKPKTWKQISVVTKMTAVTALLLLATVAIGGYAAYLVSKRQLESEIAFTGEQVVSSLAGSITSVMDKEGAKTDLQIGLKMLLNKDSGHRILEANILDKDFKILASDDPKRIDTRYTGPIQLNQLDRLKAFPYKESSRLIATPVIFKKVQIRGYVVIEFGNAAIERAKRQTILWFTLIFVLAVAATTFITRVVMKKFLRPAVDVAKACRALARGDYSYRLKELLSNDEFGLVVGSFNYLANALELHIKFSNPAFVDKVENGLDPTKTNSARLTVGFSDGVKFTDWSAQNPTGELTAEMLSDYFTLAGAAIAYFGGNLEKTIGDALMDYFGLDKSKTNLMVHSRNAVRAKICVQRSFQIANGLFKKYQEGRRPLEFRLGIATGECMSGPIGARGVTINGKLIGRKLDYSLIGTVVNLSSRLEGISEPGGLAIDRFTYLNTKEGGLALLTTDFRKVEVKGFEKSVEVVAVIGLEDPVEEEKLREFLRKLFAAPEVHSIFRLTTKQLPEYQADVEKSLLESIRLPIPAKWKEG